LAEYWVESPKFCVKLILLIETWDFLDAVDLRILTDLMSFEPSSTKVSKNFFRSRFKRIRLRMAGHTSEDFANNAGIVAKVFVIGG
jgi:hypothetical protein